MTSIQSVNRELSSFQSLLSAPVRRSVSMETPAQRYDRRASAIVNVCCILSGLGTLAVSIVAMGGAL